jgi:hypothetical protein
VGDRDAVALVHLLSDLPEAIALRFEPHDQLYRPLLLGDGFENPSAAGYRDASATNGDGSAEEL